MMITSFLFTSLVLTVSASPWLYVDRNSGTFMPALPFPNAQLKYKLRSGHTYNQLTSLELDCLDEGPGYHSHIREDKMYLVLEGQVQFIVNGTQFCAKAGDYVYVPRFLAQTFRVHNPMSKKKRVRVQLTFFPAGAENFLNDMTVLFLKGQDKTPLGKKTAKKYGITVLEPVVWEDIGCFEHNDN